MTQPERTPISLGPLDLAAMLCSRVCHDVISPVGAIVNGLEVLEDDSDPSMRDVAFELIKKSAASASARLQFCRLAFGAAGSAGASIDTGDAEAVARGLLETEKTSIDWKAPRRLLSKNNVKLLFNLAQIAAATIPRGGVVEVQVEGRRRRGRSGCDVARDDCKAADRVRRFLEGRDRRGTCRRPQHPALFRRARGSRMRNGDRYRAVGRWISLHR